MNSKIAIVGAGITGLTAAHRVKKSGKKVHLFDRKPEPGGVIGTEDSAGWRYELGPNTLLLKDPEVEKLINDLNLTDRIVTANQQASKRFIVKEGQLHELPTSFSGFLSTALFSGRAKRRLLREPFAGKVQPGATVAQFFHQRFGAEILNYAVNPFIAGIYAGSPDQLSLKHTFPALHRMQQESGSVLLGGIRKMIKGRDSNKPKRRLISFQTGLQELPKALISDLEDTRLNQEIKKTEHRSDGWFLQTESAEYGPYSDVVITVPLHKWNRELLPFQHHEIQTIKSVTYPPLSVLVLGYKKEDIEHPLDGFGFLVPEKEGRSVLGALFTSTLFKNRAPAGYHLLTVFIGGSRQPELAGKTSAELLDLTKKDLADLIGLKDAPNFNKHIYWPRSIPQYHTGYDDVLAVFDSLEKNNPGLHLAGNFRGGVSVPDCIKNGLILGEKLAAG